MRTNLNISYFIIVLILFCGLLIPTPMLLAQNGVYISKPKTSEGIDLMIEEYVRKKVFFSMTESVFDIIKRLNSTQELNLMPQLAYVTSQRISLYAFEHETTQEFIRDAYHQAISVAEELRELHTDSSEINIEVDRKIEEALKPVYENVVFREITRQIVNKAVGQQRMLLTQEAIKSYIQQTAVQQQALEDQLHEAYVQSIASILVR